MTLKSKILGQASEKGTIAFWMKPDKRNLVAK
jgi:hypothetical protein